MLTSHWITRRLNVSWLRGGLTPEAEKALHAEMEKRGFDPASVIKTFDPKNPKPNAEPEPLAINPGQAKPVRLVSIDISFSQMVMLTVKFSLAAIPAAIILAIIYFAVGALFWGIWQAH